MFGSTFNSEGFVRTAYVVHYTQAGRPSARRRRPRRYDVALSGSTPSARSSLSRGYDIWM